MIGWRGGREGRGEIIKRFVVFMVNTIFPNYACTGEAAGLRGSLEWRSKL